MVRIKELLNKIIKILKDSSKHSQADWLRKRLEALNADDSAVIALKDIKSIIAGIGSLSDIYLEVSKDISIDEEQYNAIYRSLIQELDFEISIFLKNI